MTAEIEVYEDDAGEWRWRLKAGNGETIADGAEGYDSRHNAERAVDTVRATFAEVSA
jgi:uncharacterized protein YegP (UPF0339 family)